MFDKTKTNPELGREVEAHLKSKGIHTPMSGKEFTAEEQIAVMKKAFTDIMEVLGLDLTDDSLMDTPNRVAKMYAKETMWGLSPDNFPKCTTVDNKMNYTTMVCERDIKTMSQWEHHFVTIDGKTTIAYIPNKRVLGLSKLNRIVEYFSRRPQIQERLTMQIAETLKYILDTDDVAVVTKAKHYCVASRGIEDVGSDTVTASLHGVFMDDPAVRSEYMAYVPK